MPRLDVDEDDEVFFHLPVFLLGGSSVVAGREDVDRPCEFRVAGLHSLSGFWWCLETCRYSL